MPYLADTFAALADETRFAVVERLMAEGELPAGALVAEGRISAPAMSRHLRVLHDAGLVTRRRDGTKRLYAVRPEAIRALAEWTMDHRAFWEAGLDRLEVALAETKAEDGHG